MVPHLQLQLLSISGQRHNSLPPASTLLVLLRALQDSITQFCLSWCYEADPEVVQVISRLPPQLQRLVVASSEIDEAKYVDAGPPPALINFLHGCTSLRSFVFSTGLHNWLYDALLAIPAPIVLLEVFHAVLGTDSESTPDEWAATYIAVLDLPCLKGLKRWRFLREVIVDTTDGLGAVWLAKCAERGIEMRDKTRYFTGKPCVLYSIVVF